MSDQPRDSRGRLIWQEPAPPTPAEPRDPITLHGRRVSDSPQPGFLPVRAKRRQRTRADRIITVIVVAITTVALLSVLAPRAFRQSVNPNSVPQSACATFGGIFRATATDNATAGYPLYEVRCADGVVTEESQP
jgi:hypothetical protein